LTQNVRGLAWVSPSSLAAIGLQLAIAVMQALDAERIKVGIIDR
jgi:hypothetical protein